MSVIKNKSTPENREFWEHVERVADEVRNNPQFQKHERAACSCPEPDAKVCRGLPEAAPSYCRTREVEDGNVPRAVRFDSDSVHGGSPRPGGPVRCQEDWPATEGE